MADPLGEKPIADTLSRASDVEKYSAQHDEPAKSKLAQFEDPDEGLSPEEKAKIVCHPSSRLTPARC